MKSRPLKWLMGFCVGALAAALFLAFGLPVLIAGFAEGALREAGFPDAKVEGVQISPGALIVDRVQLAPGAQFALRTILADLDWRHFKLGQIQAAHLDLKIDSAAIPGYAPPAARPDAPAKFPQLPFASFDIRDVNMTVDMKDLQGEFKMGSASIRQKKGAPHILVNLLFQEGRLEHKALSLKGVNTIVALGYQENMPLIATWSLRADEARLYGQAPLPLDANIKMTGDKVEASIETGESDIWGLNAKADANLAGKEFSFSGVAEVKNLQDVKGVGLPLTGAFRLIADLKGQWGQGLDDAVAKGALYAMSRDFGYRGLVRHLSADIGGALSFSRRQLTLDPKGKWIWSARLAPELLPASLAGLGASALGGNVTNIKGDDGPRLELKLGEPLSLSFSGALSMAGGKGVSLRAQMPDLSIERRAENGVSVSAPTLSLQAEHIPYNRARLSIPAFDGKASYGAGGWMVAGAAKLALDGHFESLAVRDMQVDWRGAVTGQAGNIEISAGECVQIRAAGLSFNDIKVDNSVFPCLEPKKGEPFLLYEAGGHMLRLNMATKAMPWQLRYAKGRAAPVRLNGVWPDLDLMLAADLTKGAIAQAEVTLAKFDVTAKEQGVRLEGGHGRLSWRDGWLHSADIKVDQVTSLAAPALWTPLELSVKAAPQKKGPPLIDAVLGDLSGALILEAKGPAARDKGALDLNLYPISFFPEVREFNSIVPALGGEITASTGMISFAGRFGWQGDKLSGDGVLSLADIGFKAPSAAVAGVNGDIHFASLYPPLSAGPQTLTIASIDPGVLLTQGQLRFDLDQANQLKVQQIQFDVAQGRLSAAPFILDLSDMGDFEVTLIGEGLMVEDIFRMTGIEGLSGSGKLSGRVPLKMGENGLEIADGVLDAGREGRLTYDPADPPAFLVGDDMQTSMLRQVLKNFQYEKFSLKLGGLLGAEQQVRLETRGRNPDFLDGHPVELNVNLRGPLANVLQNTLTPYNLPEALEKNRRQNKEQDQKDEPKP